MEKQDYLAKNKQTKPQPTNQPKKKKKIIIIMSKRGFLDSSVGKESTCNAGDPGLFPGSGRSLGEGTGYPLQYSWASLVAQRIKNLLAMQETQV